MDIDYINNGPYFSSWPGPFKEPLTPPEVFNYQLCWNTWVNSLKAPKGFKDLQDPSKAFMPVKKVRF